MNRLPGGPAEPETVGDHLRARRLALGLTREDVAERLGTSALTVADWERGQRHPSYPHWPRILSFLAYDPYPVPQTLAEEIAAVQRREGWTQEEFAAELGVEPSTVWAWTMGSPPRRKRSQEALRRVGVRLGQG